MSNTESSEFFKTIGKNIKYYRQLYSLKKSKMTQEKLAELTDVSISLKFINALNSFQYSAFLVKKAKIPLKFHRIRFSMLAIALESPTKAPIVIALPIAGINIMAYVTYSKMFKRKLDMRVFFHAFIWTRKSFFRKSSNWVFHFDFKWS